MNKKQFFILSLLICPLLHQTIAQAGILRKLLITSVVAAVAMETYVAGECNKELPADKKTGLAKKGHPYLDAALGGTETVLRGGKIVFSHASECLEKAGKNLHEGREVTLPTLIDNYNLDNYNSFFKINSSEKELEQTNKTSPAPQQKDVVVQDPLNPHQDEQQK